MARWLMIMGALLLVIGALLHFAPWSLNWFGKLPGDIRIETEQGKIYIIRVIHDTHPFGAYVINRS